MARRGVGDPERRPEGDQGSHACPWPLLAHRAPSGRTGQPWSAALHGNRRLGWWQDCARGQSSGAVGVGLGIREESVPASPSSGDPRAGRALRGSVSDDPRTLDCPAPRSRLLPHRPGFAAGGAGPTAPVERNGRGDSQHSPWQRRTSQAAAALGAAPEVMAAGGDKRDGGCRSRGLETIPHTSLIGLVGLEAAPRCSPSPPRRCDAAAAHSPGIPRSAPSASYRRTHRLRCDGP